MAHEATSIQAQVGATRREATRAAILAACRTLLSESDSPHLVTVREIVAAAGVSRATFYLHFEDKRAVVAELARTEAQTALADVGGYDSELVLSREHARARVVGICERWYANRAVMGVYVRLAETDPVIREIWRDVIAAHAAYVESRIAPLRPDLPPERLTGLAFAIAWATERILHQMVGPATSPEEIDIAVEALTELAWSAMDSD